MDLGLYALSLSLALALSRFRVLGFVLACWLRVLHLELGLRTVRCRWCFLDLIELGRGAWDLAVCWVGSAFVMGLLVLTKVVVGGFGLD